MRVINYLLLEKFIEASIFYHVWVEQLARIGV